MAVGIDRAIVVCGAGICALVYGREKVNEWLGRGILCQPGFVVSADLPIARFDSAHGQLVQYQKTNTNDRKGLSHGSNIA